MSRSLGTLTLDLIAEIQEFKQGMDKASKIAEQNSREIQRSIRGIERRIQNMSRLAVSAASIFGATLTVSAFNNWIKGSLESAASAGVFAEKIGLTVEELTTFRYIAGQAGASVQDLDSSMLRLNSRLGAAIKGEGPAAKTLEKLNLNAKKLLDLSLEDRILAISKAMEGLTRGEQLRALQNMAGDSARGLIKMFDMSKEEIQELSKNAEKLGYVYTTEMARNADMVLGQIGEIKGAFSNLSLQIINEFLPEIEDFFSSITAEDIEKATNIARIAIEDAGTAVKALSVAFGVKLVGSITASTIAFGINTAVETVNLATKLKMEGASSRAALAIAAQTMAVRGLSVAYGVLAGPVGILAVAAGSFMYFSKSTNRAAFEVDELEGKLADLEKRIDRMSEKQLKREHLNFSKDIEAASNERKALEKELATTEEMLSSYQERLKLPGYANDKSTLLYIDQLKDKQTELGGKIDDTSDSLKYLNKMLGMVEGALNGASVAGDNAFSNTSKRFEDLAGKLRDEIGRIGLRSSSEVFEYELVHTDKYSDLNDAEIEKLRVLHKQKDAKEEQYRLSVKSSRAATKGIDLAKEYQRIMESTLSDEERRGLELQKNLDILRQYGASEEDMLAVRRAAYESMSVDLPGYDGSGNTLTAQLTRINENMEELDKWREEQLQKIQQAYGDEESALAESIARKEEIEQQYRERRAQYEGEMSQELLNIGQNLSAESLSALEAAGMEASGIYKAMFLANKAAAFANAVVSAHEAATKAYAAYPDPIMGISVGAMVKGIGLANAGIIAATGLKGMAHSGIDKVPETGTWLLEKGERVVTANTSARLDAILDDISRQKENGSLNAQAPVVHSTVSVVVNSDGAVEERDEETGGNQISKVIEGKVVEVIVKELRPGGILARN